MSFSTADLKKTNVQSCRFLYDEQETMQASIVHYELFEFVVHKGHFNI